GQLVERTCRVAAIESVAVNVFTGRRRVTGLRLAERQGPEAFVELERLDARLALTALLRSEIRRTELTLVAPSGQMVRTASGEFNFSDMLQHVAAARASRGSSPERWTVAVDRLTITKGAVRVRDETVAPAPEWWVHALEADLGEITTRPGAAPGHGVAHALLDEARL